MHLVLALLLTVLTLVTAVPTPAIAPRGECSTIPPYQLQRLDSTKPDFVLFNDASTGTSEFSIMQGITNVSTPYRSVQLVEFQIPPGSHTCTLYIADTQSSVAYTRNKAYSSSAVLNVISLTANSRHYNGATYSNVFNPNSGLIASQRWSSVTLGRGDNPKVVNSCACPEAVKGVAGTLQFVFEFEGFMSTMAINGGGSDMASQAGGRVEREDVFSLKQSFSSTAVAGKVTSINGVYMTYNC